MAKVLKKALLDGALMHPSEFLNAVELQGRDATVTIETVKMNDLPREGSSKKDVLPVLTFVGKKKKLVLNKTNASVLVGLYGEHAKGWIGKAVTLYPTTTRFGADTVNCIRIREEVPQSKPTQQPPATGSGKPIGKGDAPTDDEIDAAMNSSSDEQALPPLPAPPPKGRGVA